MFKPTDKAQIVLHVFLVDERTTRMVTFGLNSSLFFNFHDLNNQLKSKILKFQKYKGHESSSKSGLVKDTISFPTYQLQQITTLQKPDSTKCIINETCSVNRSTLNHYETGTGGYQQNTDFSDCLSVDIQDEFTDLSIKSVDCHTVHYTAVFCMGQSHTEKVQSINATTKIFQNQLSDIKVNFQDNIFSMSLAQSCTFLWFKLGNFCIKLFEISSSQNASQTCDKHGGKLASEMFTDVKAFDSNMTFTNNSKFNKFLGMFRLKTKPKFFHNTHISIEQQSNYKIRIDNNLSFPKDSLIYLEMKGSPFAPIIPHIFPHHTSYGLSLRMYHISMIIGANIYLHLLIYFNLLWILLCVKSQSLPRQKYLNVHCTITHVMMEPVFMMLYGVMVEYTADMEKMKRTVSMSVTNII